MSSSIEPPTIFRKSLVNYLTVVELLSINSKNLPKCFSQREAIRDLLKPLNFSCCICRIENTSGRAKRFDSLFALKCHVSKAHHNFSDSKTGLTESKIQDLIDLLDLILFLRLIS
jgi:hypothetical protein